MDFLVDYSLFLAKAVTALVFIVLLLTVITSFSQRSKREGEDGHVEVSRLHERFEDWQDTMNYGLLSEEKYKKLRKDKKKQHKAERKAKQPARTNTDRRPATRSLIHNVITSPVERLCCANRRISEISGTAFSVPTGAFCQLCNLPCELNE